MSDIDPKITRKSDKETIDWLLKVQAAQQEKLCDNCREPLDEYEHNHHRCRADISSCIEGINCPDYVESCDCVQCADDPEGQQLSKAFDQVLDGWDWDKSTAELEKIVDQEVKAFLQRKSEAQAKAVAEFKLRGNMAHLRPQPIDVVPYGDYIWEDPFIT